MTESARLVDPFGRQITYLRLSLTDRCDFRCVYCMSENMQFVPRSQLLSLEECIRIASAAVNCGIQKIRLTGGEPLTRRNVLSVFQALGKLDKLKELCLTTNGSQLSNFASKLKDAGLKRINISLDSLQSERFKRITRLGELDKTLKGIDAAIAAGFAGIKLNAVILKNRNHDEICDLAQFAVDKGIDISFIEEMPLGIIEEHDRAEAYYSSDQVLADLDKRFSLLASTFKSGGPSRYYQVANSNTKIGFISPHSHNFCASCNRIRITAEGRLLLCLGQENAVDLRRLVRANPENNEHNNKKIEAAIVEALSHKPKQHDFNLQAKPVILRHMNHTGG